MSDDIPGLSRVLTDPERETLERLRAAQSGTAFPYRHRRADADVAAVVAVVERLAAAPAPEALTDAVAEVIGREYDLADPDDEGFRPAPKALARAVLAVVGPAATHETDTDGERAGILRAAAALRERAEQMTRSITASPAQRMATFAAADYVDSLAASRAAATDSGEGR